MSEKKIQARQIEMLLNIVKGIIFSAVMCIIDKYNNTLQTKCQPKIEEGRNSGQANRIVCHDCVLGRSSVGFQDQTETTKRVSVYHRHVLPLGN